MSTTRDIAAPGELATHPAPRGRRRLVRVAVGALACAALVVVLGPRATTWLLARGEIAHRTSDVPALAAGEHRAAVVLGAGVVDDRPSRLLDDRIRAAVGLYEDDRVDVLVMSGDNSTEYYDEPTVMRARAIELGVPATAVAADYAGRRTWDTCRRAHDVFGLDEAVVVTSAFHADRAVVTCRAAGVDALGYSVRESGHARGNRVAWRMRELAATGRALVDAWIVRPEPAVGGASIDPWDPCEVQRSLAPSDAARNERMTGLSCG